MGLISDIVGSSRSSNFFYSFMLLPQEKRIAILTLYDFCRRTDDIVDNHKPDEQKRKSLELWKTELITSFNGNGSNETLMAVVNLARKYSIDRNLLLELIEGVQMDLDWKRYETFEELYPYCYRVGSTVGLMSIEVFGYKTEEAKEYAVNLGIALQLTNILRDLRPDLSSDRIYLPQADLRACGYDEENLRGHVVNGAYRSLIRKQCDRARSYFTRAKDLLKKEEAKTLYPAINMSSIYERILDRIERQPSELFRREVGIPPVTRLALALKTWVGARISHADAV